MPWWAAIKPPQPKAEELAVTKRRRRRWSPRKATSRSRTSASCWCGTNGSAPMAGTETISPGVALGVWWLALTANRRFTLSQLRRCDLQESDPMNPYSSADRPLGHCRMADEKRSKNRTRFLLPVPPIGLHIAIRDVGDWRLLVGKKRGFRRGTEWLFASTRRRSRRGHPDNPDPGLYPNSLNAHLRAMRGRKKTERTR